MTDYIAEAEKLTPAVAGCYDCNWTERGPSCAVAMEKHREEHPTHWVWWKSTPTGTDVTGAHERLDPSVA